MSQELSLRDKLPTYASSLLRRFNMAMLTAKRRIAYTQEEAEAAIGLKTDNGVRSSFTNSTPGKQPEGMEVEDTGNG